MPDSLPEGFEHTKTLPKVEPFECIDVPWGGYVVVDLKKSAPIKPRILETIGYLECMCPLACVLDDKGEPVRWGLAHIMMENNPVTAVHTIEQDLRTGNPALRIHWDVVGGMKKFPGGEEFAQTILTTISGLPHSSVNNLLFDKRAISNISVDLETGRKFVGPPEEMSFSLCDIIDFIRDEVHPQGRWFLRAEQDASDNKIWGVLPLSKYEWEKELPEIQRVWRDESKRGQIMAKVVKDMIETGRLPENKGDAFIHDNPFNLPIPPQIQSQQPKGGQKSKELEL